MLVSRWKCFCFHVSGWVYIVWNFWRWYKLRARGTHELKRCVWEGHFWALIAIQKSFKFAIATTCPLHHEPAISPMVTNRSNTSTAQGHWLVIKDSTVSTGDPCRRGKQLVVWAILVLCQSFFRRLVLLWAQFINRQAHVGASTGHLHHSIGSTHQACPRERQSHLIALRALNLWQLRWPACLQI